MSRSLSPIYPIHIYACVYMNMYIYIYISTYVYKHIKTSGTTLHGPQRAQICLVKCKYIGINITYVHIHMNLTDIVPFPSGSISRQIFWYDSRWASERTKLLCSVKKFSSSTAMKRFSRMLLPML